MSSQWGNGSAMERLAYTPAEMAAVAGLSRKAIYAAIASGELKAAEVCKGSRLLVPCEAAQDWLERHIVVPGVARESRAAHRQRPRENPRVLGEALKRVDRVDR